MKVVPVRQNPRAAPTRLTHGKRAQAERTWWHALISPALAHPRGSIERGAAVQAIASREHINAFCEVVQPSRRTIERRIAAFEAEGIAGLGPRQRCDAGFARVVVSKAWDAAVSDVTVRRAIVDELRDYVRALHKNHVSRGQLIARASAKLKELTSEHHFELSDRICRVPRTFIEAERRFRKAGQRRKDAKAYEDQRPRISRTSDGLQPMDLVFGDVHPLDFLLPDEPGLQRYAKAISWLDQATQRIWVTVVVLQKGKGIRNAHVIESFKEMTAAWGAPRTLYLDNGREYDCADFIDDALKLIDPNGARLIHIEKRSSNIVRARPYNAPAKPIEGVFANLEKNYFSSLPGWIGGDRMAQKTANVGKAPIPYPGTARDFGDDIRAAIHLYHAQPQRGRALNGRSPRDALAAAIDAGWMMTAIDPAAFAVAFSTEVVRSVRQGRIEYDDAYWTDDALYSYLHDKVTVLIPKYDVWDVLPVRGVDGRLLCFARRDEAFPFLDPRGARESSRRARLANDAVRDLERAAPTIDPLDDHRRAANQLLPMPVAPVGATLTASDEAKRINEAVAETPTARKQRQIDKAQTDTELILAVGERFRNARRAS